MNPNNQCSHEHTTESETTNALETPQPQPQVKVLQIHLLGSTLLRGAAAPVEVIDDSIRQLADLMVATMRNVKGIGLAAPQVGIPLRIFVMEDQKTKEVYQLCNPEIEEVEGEQELDEGCLSQPGLQVKMKRPQSVTIGAVNIQTGEKIRIEGNDLDAAILSHEIDHLNGKMLCDYISRLKRDLYKKKLIKMIKRYDRSNAPRLYSTHKRQGRVYHREPNK